jgi:hypothetical protein
MNLETPETVRPPVFLGCFLAIAAVLAVLFFGAFAVKFFESGANDGKVRMNVPDAYAIGSVEFVGANNFFLVRLTDATFLALSDLDAANRANQARRCRVALTDVADSSLGVETALLEAKMTAGATGARAVFRETCNGAIYDIAGARLAGDGPNLDRYPMTIGADGHLVVDTSKRECTQRQGASAFADRACD